ncbi:MAG: hypothetical protein GEU68_11675 [Actinobacteria bacterium]|nr:hypothetical protein [Actinomycetota bacterium]
MISVAYLICRVLLRVVVSGVRPIDAKDVEILVLRHQLDVHRRARLVVCLGGRPLRRWGA